MQMLANFCQHLSIYNQATWKSIHPSSFFAAKCGCGFGRKYSENVELSATGLNLTQNLQHQRLMNK
jgi:hypothetical protein